VRTHQRAVFQIALSVLDDTRSPSLVTPEVLYEAEAATRATFQVVLDRLNHYREDMPFETWLYRVAVVVSRRRYRSWKLRRGFASLWRRLLLTKANGSQDAWRTRSEAAVVEARLQPGDAELWQVVRALPENLRLAVVLRYYHDLSIADIARVLHLSEGAVHARLDAARERVAKETS
jgi:RNA polymerase sigma-70 factor, ECF subfamily